MDDYSIRKQQHLFLKERLVPYLANKDNYRYGLNIKPKSKTRFRMWMKSDDDVLCFSDVSWISYNGKEEPMVYMDDITCKDHTFWKYCSYFSRTELLIGANTYWYPPEELCNKYAELLKDLTPEEFLFAISEAIKPVQHQERNMPWKRS